MQICLFCIFFLGGGGGTCSFGQVNHQFWLEDTPQKTTLSCPKGEEKVFKDLTLKSIYGLNEATTFVIFLDIPKCLPKSDFRLPGKLGKHL